MTAARGWFPVALSSDIEPGTVAGTRLFGDALVVWREEGGGVHVWEDRCPHRGMRLSFGFVRGDRLGCLYHGWRFDPAGRCRFIPAHPALEVPASITATRHVAAERAGLLWVLWGAGEATEPPPDAGGTFLPVRSLTVDAPLKRLREALPAARSAADGPLLDFAVGADGIVAALQPLGTHATCLHLLVAAPPGGEVDAQKRVSAWAERLRRLVEEAAA